MAHLVEDLMYRMRDCRNQAQQPTQRRSNNSTNTAEVDHGNFRKH
jgi:hypothetical protein